jgi:dynein heavy chain
MKMFENGILQLKQRIHNLTKENKDKVLETHAHRVANVTQMMPVIVALGNKDLKQRHWTKIFSLLGSQTAPGATFTL